MSSEAPFVPHSALDDPMPTNMWGAFREHGYWRLFLAQCVSSLGDWIGIFAILSIAFRVSNDSGAAVALVMFARIVPGFFLASIGGLLVDKWDRRHIMISCDLGRAGLLILLPFCNTLWGLVAISLVMEVFTLLWSPAKDASLPHLIEEKHLATANSLSLLAAYGTMPIGALLFAGLARLAGFVNSKNVIGLNVDQEFLALWADATTFLISAALIFSLARAFKNIRIIQLERLAEQRAEHAKHIDPDVPKKKIDITSGIREIKEGYKFIGQNRLVRGVMLGLGVGIIGGGALVPLGPVYAKKILNGGTATFSLLMTSLGTGAAIGIVTLLFLQRYLKRGTAFWCAIVFCGISMIVVGISSAVLLSMFSVGCVGGFAGAAYVTGFTVLQEEVADDVRGRTFAALYAIVRVCMIFALAVSPIFADVNQWFILKIFGTTQLHIGTYYYDVPGVRVAIIFGGIIVTFAGFLCRSQVVHPDRPSRKELHKKHEEATKEKHERKSEDKISEHDAPEVKDAPVGREQEVIL